MRAGRPSGGRAPHGADQVIETVLVLNAGSSSLRFQVFRVGDLDVLARGKAVRLGEPEPVMDASLANGTRERIALPPACDHDTAFAAVLAFVVRHDDAWRMKAIVHRIVHGGEHSVDPVMVTPDVFAGLEVLSPLAPLHQPHNLAAVTAARRLMGDVPNIACFDTAFHARHDALTHNFALEQGLRDKGIRRYGFHGLSYRWLMALAEQYPKAPCRPRRGSSRQRCELVHFP